MMMKRLACWIAMALCLCSTLAAETLKHKVRKGETLSVIAKSYGVTLSSIKQANNIKDANKIRIGQTLTIPGASKGYIEYKIQNGDSLSAIAADHGLSTRTLARFNGIRNANKIRVGQVIKIPKSSTASAPSIPGLPSSLKRTLDRIAVKRGQWKYIVIHHSATKADRAKNMARYHREERRMEHGLAYHFVIENGTRGTRTGDVYIGDRWKKQIHGGHMASYHQNKVSIGICLVGNFEEQRPREDQLKSLEALIRYLVDKAGVPKDNITTHTLHHPNHTVCPGKYFPVSRLKNMAK